MHVINLILRALNMYVIFGKAFLWLLWFVVNGYLYIIYYVSTEIYGIYFCLINKYFVCWSNIVIFRINNHYLVENMYSHWFVTQNVWFASEVFNWIFNINIMFPTIMSFMLYLEMIITVHLSSESLINHLENM